MQLALEGVPSHTPKHTVGKDIIGADLGPSTIALVPREAEASLSVFCEERTLNEQRIRRLQRTMDRQRRAATPDNDDSHGRVRKTGKKKLHWKQSTGSQNTRRRTAEKERTLAASCKRLHGRTVHEIVAVGTTIMLATMSSKAWQRQSGKRVGMRAPGMCVEQWRRTVARTGGTVLDIPRRQATLS